MAQDEQARIPLQRGVSLRGTLYTMGRLLDEGGFSLIYAGLQGDQLWPVAIKEFYPKTCSRADDGRVLPGRDWDQDSYQAALQSFAQEGRALRMFHHPNIVRILDGFEENGTYYLVEELLEGISLGKGLSSAGRMPVERVLDLAKQVGQALTLVHARGLLHGDVKPDNFYWTREGRYVIVDFGLAQPYGPEAKRRFRGASPGYSPPEQFRPDGKLTPASDIYALGATLLHLVTGVVPPDSRQRSSGQPLPQWDLVPESMRAPLAKALQLDPAQRFQNLEEFFEAFGVDVSEDAKSLHLGDFQLAAEREAHASGVRSLVLDAERGKLYSGGGEGNVRCWSWPDLELEWDQPAHKTAVVAMAISPDGSWATSSRAGEIAIRAQPVSGEGSAVVCLSFGPDGSLVAGREDGTCQGFHPSGKRAVWAAADISVTALAFSSDGRLLAGLRDGRVQVWSWPPERTPVSSWEAHGSAVTDMHFNADQTMLLTSGQDSCVKLWSWPELQELRDFPGHKAKVFQARFDCSEQLIVSASADSRLRAFRVGSCRLVLSTVAHQGMIRALLVSPHEHRAVTGGQDGFLRSWTYSF